MLRDQKGGPRGSKSIAFANGFCSAIKSSEMPPEIPSELHLEIPFETSPATHIEIFVEISPELHLEMHFEISPNNDIYGRSIGVCATLR